MKISSELNKNGEYIRRGQFAESLELLKSIPWVSLWSLSLVVGGLLLLGYFSSIEYLPDIDLQSISMTVVGVAVVGLYVVFVIGLGLILPTLFLDGSVGTDKRARLHLVLQAAIGILAAFLILINVFYEYPYKQFGWFATFVLFIAACGLLVLNSGEKTKFSYFMQIIMKGSGWGCWALMIPMLFYRVIIGSNDPEWVTIIGLLAFPILFGSLSIIVAMMPPQKRVAAQFAAGVIAVFLLGSIAQRPALVSQITVAMLGLSIKDRVTLVLTEMGCNSVNMLLDGRPCMFDIDKKLGNLSDVRLVSRIGSQFVIHWRPTNTTAVLSGEFNANADDDRNWRRAILKKEDVISWAYDFNKKKQRSDKGKGA